MAGQKRKGKKPYYGKKGGTAEYKDEMKFDIYSTLKSLKEFYAGHSKETKKD